MKKWLIDTFDFSKREYNGLLYFALLSLVLCLFPYAYRYYYQNKNSYSEKEALAIQQLVLVDRYQKRTYEKSKFNPGNSDKFKKPTYYKFDTNTAEVKDWQSFGLSPKQALSIVNYVKKGGKFYKPEDLKRMYTISPEKYEALLPYVAITLPANGFEKKPGFTYTKKEAVIVEINSADTLELDKIKGVGLSFARRIVKYRERLGGFHTKEQLFEVFGVDTPKFNEIKDQVRIDVNFINKININTAEFDDLK